MKLIRTNLNIGMPWKNAEYTVMGSMHGGISGEGLRMLDNFRRS